jgi:glutaredoxin
MRMSREVTLYSLSTCPHCRRVKAFFAEHHVQYTNYDVGENEAYARRMIELSGQDGVPMTIIDDSMVIGDDLEKIGSLLGISS